MTTFPVHLEDERATRDLGARIATVLRPGMSMHLIGDLGAGKTTLVRGLLGALGFQGKVKSPTYTLVELYTVSSLDLYHFDLYRFRSSDEWHEAGFDEYFNGRSVCMVEWPEKAAALLPVADLVVTLALAADGGRDAHAHALTETGTTCLQRLRTA